MTQPKVLDSIKQTLTANMPKSASTRLEHLKDNTEMTAEIKYIESGAKIAERVAALDFIKECAIVLVVMGHFIQFNWQDVWIGNQEAAHPAYNWIYSFHMPVFFFTSAFLMELANKRAVVVSLKRKTLGLVVPYITWCFLISPFSTQKVPTWHVFFDVDGYYWFVIVLYLMSLCYLAYVYIVKKFNVHNRLIDFLIIALVFTIVLLFYQAYPCNLFFRSMAFSPFFIAGVYYCRYVFQKGYKLSRNCLTLLLLSFVVASLSYGTPYLYSKYVSDLAKIVAGISASLLSMQIATSDIVDYNNSIIRALCYCGKNSIVIYLVHFSLLSVLEDAIIPTNFFSPFWSLVLSLFPSIVISVSALLLGKVTSFFPWINRILFGRGW